ncbi:MAG: potassium-transporting ATPase subunit C [Clostridia bacterium]
MCLLVFTVLCGIIYPLSVTLIAQTAFPYEANGSQIVVTLPDGSQKIYGSELIGQSYESAKYLFGRVNTGAPTNLSPESEEYKALLNERINERREKLNAVGYVETSAIPSELITSSGSGVDPHISPETAYFQVGVIVAARNLNVNDDKKITDEYVKEIIKKYTEKRFLGIFGEKRVNVLLVNLALDSLL